MENRLAVDFIKPALKLPFDAGEDGLRGVAGAQFGGVVERGAPRAAPLDVQSGT